MDELAVGTLDCGGIQTHGMPVAWFSADTDAGQVSGGSGYRHSSCLHLWFVRLARSCLTGQLSGTGQLGVRQVSACAEMGLSSVYAFRSLSFSFG